MDSAMDNASSMQRMKPMPVKPDPVVVPRTYRNPLRRRHYWVTVRKDQPLPRGRIVWAEPWGGGGLAGGLKICVVRRG